MLLIINKRVHLHGVVPASQDQVEGTSPTEEMESAMLGLLQAIRDLRVQLVRTVVDQTSELQATTKTGLDIVEAVRNYALSSDTERIDEIAERFQEVLDHILEVRLLCYLRMAPHDYLSYLVTDLKTQKLI